MKKSCTHKILPRPLFKDDSESDESSDLPRTDSVSQES